MKNDIYFAKGQIPDGYVGDWVTVEFRYNPSNKKTLVYYNGCYFTYSTPLADSIQEAAWLVQNHPSSNARFITE